MSTSSPKSRDNINPGTGWTLISAALVLAAILIGLPTIIVGFLLQRGSLRLITSWRLRFLLWFGLAAIGAYLWYRQHVALETLIIADLSAYILAIKHHQLDLAQWNWPSLWGLTWPVWIRTTIALGMVGFWQEIGTNMHTDTAQMLKAEQRRQQQHITRSQQRASRRTRQPARIPDAIGGEMVMGIPIHDQEE